MQQYTTFQGNSAMPQSVKNLTSGASQASTPQSVQGIVHNLPHQQITTHQKPGVSFGPPAAAATIRTVSFSDIK